jgi:hypothetical protein
LARKRRIKKKKKKKKKKPAIEFEDPSLREQLLAGAYGGVAKPKIKRPGVKYTTDIDAGLRDVVTAGLLINDPSRRNFGIASNAGGESARGRKMNRSKDGRLESGRHAPSEVGSALGSRAGGLNYS